MSGSTDGPKQETQQSQNTVSNPWAPSQPLLQNILGNISGTSTGVTPEQSAALQQLFQSSGSLPNFAPQATGAVSQLYGSSTAPQTGILSDAYSNLQKTLSPYTSAGYTDPTKTPGISDALSSTTSDITNQIKSQFAKSGRDFSPDYVQSLSRGLTSGLAPILTNQYNANVGAQQGAAGTLYGAGSGTATTGAQLGQIPLQNQLQALQAQGTLPGLLTQPAMTQLAAANTAQGLPGQNIAGQENLVLPIAGLGGQTSGTGTSTTTSQTPLINTLLSAGALAAGTAGALSDERAKENIERVGLLHNGLPVYKYNYRHDPLKTTQVGLLAQEVERMLPEAVIEDDSGLKYVNYNLATAPPANAMAA